MDNNKQTIRGKILIVDDSPLICEMFSKVLSEKGYEIAIAYDGESAPKELSSEDFQVMLLDLVMSGMGGMDVLKECRKNYPGLCVIVVTAYGSEENAVEAVREEADGYIIKDFIMQNNAKGLDIIISHGLETRRRAVENSELTKQLKELNEVLKAAYSRIKDEKEYFNNLFANAEYAIVLTKNGGDIFGFNDFLVKMTGYSERDLCKMCIFDIIESESGDHVKSVCKQTRPCISHAVKTRIVTKAQKSVDVTLNATSFTMGGGERLILMAIIPRR